MLQIPSSKSSTIATWWGDKGDDNEAQQVKEWDQHQSWQGHGLGQDPHEEDEWSLEQKKFEQKRVDQRTREQNAIRAPGDSYCCCCCSSLLKLWGNFNFRTLLPSLQRITSWSIFQLDFVKMLTQNLLGLLLLLMMMLRNCWWQFGADLVEMLMFGWDFEVDAWSKFLKMQFDQDSCKNLWYDRWYSGTQLSGPLCLWQCFQYDTTLL